MKIVIVGLGDIAQKAYLPIVTSHPEITPVFCTRNPEVLTQLRQKYRVSEAYTDFSDALKSHPDAVMVHSATSSHYQIAKQCLELGIPVFVDKPLSDQLAQCEALLALAQKTAVPLFVGFNRRYAPLYQAPLEQTPIDVHYQKNRFNQPDNARRFIYDDFIHVLDFVAFASPNKVEHFDVFHHNQGESLAAIQMQWQQKGALFTAKMNRVSGANLERLEYFSLNQHWQIENLRQGNLLRDKQNQELRFDDWHATLHKRGFVDMLEDFLSKVKTGKVNQDYLDSIWQSHWLCEQAVLQVEQS